MHFFVSDEADLITFQLSEKNSHWNFHAYELAGRAIIKSLIDEKIIDEKYLIVAEPGAETFGRDKNVKAIHLQ